MSFFEEYDKNNTIEEEANENLVFSHKDLEFNKDKWKPKRGQNVMLVTGFSGGGKTTISHNLKDEYPGAQVFELDGLDFRYDSTSSNLLTKLMKLNPRYEEFIKWRADNLRGGNNYDRPVPFFGNDEYREMILDLLDLMDDNPSQLYIVEGIHLYVYCKYIDIADKPIIIKGTSAVKSLYRRFMRNGKGLVANVFNKEIFDLIKWYIRDDKLLNDLKSNKKDPPVIVYKTKTKDGKKLLLVDDNK